MPDSSQVQPVNFPLQGGLVLNKSTFAMQPGEALELQNFEPDIEGGYRRINGFAKLVTNIVPQTSASTEALLLSIKFNDKNAEVNFCNFLSTCLFTKYFSEVDNIYEFGSGSGVNLQRLSETFPTKNLFGLDFSQNAIKSLNNFAKINNLNIKSSYFDLINPDISMEMKPNSAVFTEFALEQTSNKFHEFILFLLKRKPEICIHIEPMPELIKDETFSDYLSKKFNRKRNYLNGLVPFLKSLENTGLIEILDLKRVKWKRSTGTECLNYLVWKVK